MGIQINGNTDNISAVDGDLSITGITTFSQLDVGNNIKLGNAGVVTATSFVGSGANLTGISPNFTSIASNIVPDSDNARDLGTSSARWNELYIQSIKGNQNQHILYDANGAIEMFANSTQFIGMKVNGKGLEIRNNSRVIPTTSGAINFGDASNKWNEIHANSFHGDGSNLTGITGTTINNNADDRVITGSGTANTLNGESLVTIDSSGRLSVAPNAGGSGITLASQGSTYGGTVTLRNTTGSNHDWMIAVGGGDNAYVSGRGMLIRDNTTGINHTQFQTDGDLVIGDGNLVIAGNGHGIQFPNHTNTSASGTSSQDNDQLLADYEFGNWTPYDDTGTSMSGASGIYMKMGHLVYVAADMTFGNRSGGQTVVLNGLPFAIGGNAFGGGYLKYTNISPIGDILIHLNPSSSSLHFPGLTRSESSGKRLDWATLYVTYTY